MSLFYFFVLAGACLIGCAHPGGIMDNELLEKEGWAAVEEGDFARAIDMVMPWAMAGDPEAEFAVGDLILIWLDADDPKEPPRYTLDEAVSWIRKAAAKGLPQAVGVLKMSYERGELGFPEDEELAVCWGLVEDGEQDASICMEAEAKKR